MEQNGPYASGPTAAVAPVSKEAQRNAQLGKYLFDGASWFFWVAGLSVVNSLMMFFNLNRWFFFGLGSTLVVDGFIDLLRTEPEFAEMATVGVVVGIVINLLIVGVFALCGFFAMRGSRIAYIAGIILYGLDVLPGFVFLEAGMTLGVLFFHLFVVFFLIRGLWALFKLQSVMKKATADPYQTSQPI